MKRPEITLENAQAVYDYYRNRDPNPTTARVLHSIFGAVYRPTVSYGDGAQEMIERHLATGKNAILGANHTEDDDQFILASATQREPALNGFVGNSVIMAKKPLFNWLLRPTIDSFGAIPVIRSKDVAKASGPGLAKTEVQELKTISSDLLIDTCIEKVDRNYNLAIFPENTRNKKEPKVVQKIYNGIGRVACGAANQEDLLLVLFGMYYPPDRSRFQPHVHVTAHKVPDTQAEVVDLTGRVLQENVDTSIQMAA